MDLSVGGCQVKRSIAYYLKFKFLLSDIQIVVRFTYDNFQTQMVDERKSIFLSIAELHFSLTTTPSDSRHEAKKVIYDVPHPSSINDSRVYPCCGLFKLEKWEVRYHSCADIIQPYR